MNQVHQESESRMKKSLEALQNELTKLRTGRAHPSLIEHIKVKAYGTDTPLQQVGNIAVEDARTLAVTAWDKGLIPDIEKAIHGADLGLNPVTAGNVVRVPLPQLTEERRKSLAKIVRDEGEKTKVAIRNIRRDANTQVKDALKAKDITEDDARKAEDDMQKLTDKYIKECDTIVSAKEADIMAV